MGINLRFKTIKPETVFIVIALIYGLAFLFITPPLQICDEWSHYAKAYGLSEGTVIPTQTGNKSGFFVPKNVADFAKSWAIQLPLKYYVLYHWPSDKHLTLLNFEYLSVIVYSPIPYVMPALAMKIGSILNLTPLILLYLARFVNLIVWIILVYFAIKIIPIYKWVLLLLSLMPMSLSLAASVSADNLTLALSFLLVAYILKLTFDNSFNNKNFIILLILGLLLFLTKSIYGILLFLFLLIPTVNFGDYKRKYGTFLVILIPGLLASFAWLLLTKGLYQPNIPNCSVNGQILYILHQPLHFLHVMGATMIFYFKFYLISLVGNLGPFLNHPLPLPLIILYLGILIFVALIDKNKSYTINFRQKIICLIVSLAIIFAVFMFDYVTWNSIGGNVINGVFGRYFIPIALPLLLLLYNNREYVTIFNHKYSLKVNKLVKTVIIYIIVITLIIALTILIASYP